MQMLHVDSFVFHYLGAIEYSIYNHNTHTMLLLHHILTSLWCVLPFFNSLLSAFVSLLLLNKSSRYITHTLILNRSLSCTIPYILLF